MSTAPENRSGMEKVLEGAEPVAVEARVGHVTPQAPSPALYDLSVATRSIGVSSADVFCTTTSSPGGPEPLELDGPALPADADGADARSLLAPMMLLLEDCISWTG